MVTKVFTILFSAEAVAPPAPPVKTTVQMSAHVALRKRSVTSTISDTDPYDEIDYNNDKPHPSTTQKGTSTSHTLAPLGGGLCKSLSAQITYTVLVYHITYQDR